jgi:hypothetical protein
MQMVNALIAENAGNDTAPGGEPLRRVLQGPREIHPRVDPASNGTKQAAPGNEPVYGSSIG